MADQIKYTKENSPTQYLLEKLTNYANFKPNYDPALFLSSLADKAILYLCGEKPEKFTEPSKY